MHERHILNDLMQKINAVATAQGATKVTHVRVWLGALSHFTPVHFAEHFELASLGGVAENAAISAETSDDITHPDAQGVRLISLEVEEG